MNNYNNSAPARQPLPTLSLLDTPPETRFHMTHEAIDHASRLIEAAFVQWKVSAEVVQVLSGSAVTQYQIELAPEEDPERLREMKMYLARELQASPLRLVPVGASKTLFGLEVPCKPYEREPVYLKELVGSSAFQKSESPLTMALGKGLDGEPVVTDLETLPHLLVGGTMGSGKTMALHMMIVSLLYKNAPEDLKLVLVDPKQTAFGAYAGIPHLLCPVVTDVTQAANALVWLVHEMDRRYAVMGKVGVNRWTVFNDWMKEAEAEGKPIENPCKEGETLKPMPAIVCVVHELAEVLIPYRSVVEKALVTLAQKGRAAGIHLILATQAPALHIVTPPIKANIPARMCFQVPSRFDSQVMLDEGGAQELLRMGDMLFRRAGHEGLKRIQGCYVSNAELGSVTMDLKSKAAPQYVNDVTEVKEEVLACGIRAPEPATETNDAPADETDPVYEAAKFQVILTQRASSGYLQRRLDVSGEQAEELLARMEREGVVSQSDPSGKRDVLVSPTGEKA